MKKSVIFPEIKKANKIIGNTICLRNVKVSDAEFILTLRCDPEKSRHLSKTEYDIKKQIEWIENYHIRDGEAYFIIKDMLTGSRIGTVRLYDAKQNSFCWGSWILVRNCKKTVAIESALMVYEYAIDWLGFDKAHFDVRRENINVWRFHERFGAKRIRETENDYFYEINLNSINKSRDKYRRYLPDGIKVIWRL